MVRSHVILVGFIFVCFLVIPAHVQSQKREVSPFSPMRNRDVLTLFRNKMSADEIIAVIKNSWCHFDIFPPVLQELKKKRVPEQVLQAMVDAPYGPPAASRAGNPAEEPIYHSAAQLKDMGFVSITPIRRGEQMNTLAPDRRGAAFSIRQ